MLLIALVAFCAFPLLGCESGTTAEQSSESSSESTEHTYRVAMVLNDSINDGGWGSSAYQAMCEAAEKRGWETAYTENVEQSDWVTVMQNYCDQGYDLIFAPSGQFADAVQQVAEDNPDTHFMILSSEVTSDNIESMLPNLEQIGYLAGALAGLLTNTNQVTFVGGVELDTTATKAAAFEEAAKIVNPDCSVSIVYAGSYSDVAKGKEIAEAAISSGTDVIYGDASAVDSGEREAIQDHEGVYDIAQPSDLGSSDDDVIACSIVTDNEVMIEQCLEDVENGDFGNKVVEGSMEDGTIKVGTFSDKLVSQEIQDEFAEYAKQIEEGTFGQ
ncbi:BMP family protein [Tractidigestivibacter sp.]|uniref:BMP family protein n=1 Tax=Tractidigestivibacter sp. TaxID=2847320 RepID=UPI003D9499A6